MEWLREELNKRGMSQADLSRRSGISPSQISKILNFNSGIGKESLIAIAQALNLPREHLFRKAGLLSEESDRKKVAEQVLGYKLKELNENQLDEVINYIEFIQDRDDRQKDLKQFLRRHTREDENPPEID